MNKQCTGCVVSAGTHKPAEAMHQIDEKNSTLIANAKRLGFVADQIRALSPEGSEEDIYLTEASEVFGKCAERIAELEAQLAATQPAAQGMDAQTIKHISALSELVRMPNAEHFADAHNAAVRHLRALAAQAKQVVRDV